MLTRSEVAARGVGRIGMAALLLGAGLLGLAGCSQGPQLSGENRELIVSLATATSLQDLTLVSANAKEIEAKHQAGELGEPEFQALNAIVTLAKSGDWTHAQEQAYHLRDAQEPTAADLERVSQRQLHPDHHGRKLNPGRRPRS